MAQNVTVRIGAVLTSQFGSTFTAADKRVNAFKVTVLGLDSVLVAARRNAMGFASALNSVNAVVAPLASNVRNSTTAINAQSTAATRLAAQNRSLASSYTAVAAAMRNVRSTPPPLPRGPGGLGGGPGGSGGAHGGGIPGLNDFGQNSLHTGAVVAGAGFGIGAMFAKGFEEPVAFEKQMTMVQKRLNESTPEIMRQLTERVMQAGAGRESAFMPSEIAAAMTGLSGAGAFNIRTPTGMRQATVDEMMKSTLAIKDLLTANNLTDTEGVANATSAILQPFRRLTDVQKMADAATYVSRTSATNFMEMANAAAYAAQPMSAAGMSMEDMFAAFGVLANSGLKGSMAGTGMAGFITRLVSPMKMGREELAALGVEIKDDMTGNIRPLADIVTDFGVAMDEVGKTEGTARQLDILRKIFGLHAKTAISLINPVGRQMLKDQQKGIEANPVGDVGHRAQIIMGTTWGNLRVMAKGIQSIFSSVFMSIQGPLNTVIRAVASITEGIGHLIATVPGLGKVIGFGALGLAALLIVGGGLLIAVGTVALLVNAVVIAMPLMIAAFTLVGGVIASVFSAALPFVLPFIAVAAAVWAAWTPIKAFFTGFWDGFTAAMAPLGGVFSGLWNDIVSAAEPLIGIFQSVWEQLSFGDTQFRQIVQWGMMLGIIIGGTVATSIAVVVGLFRTIFGLVVAIAGSLYDIGTGNFSGVLDRWGKFGGTMKDVWNTTSKVGSVTADLLNKASAPITPKDKENSWWDAQKKVAGGGGWQATDWGSDNLDIGKMWEMVNAGTLTANDLTALKDGNSSISGGNRYDTDYNGDIDRLIDAATRRSAGTSTKTVTQHNTFQLPQEAAANPKAYGQAVWDKLGAANDEAGEEERSSVSDDPDLGE